MPEQANTIEAPATQSTPRDNAILKPHHQSALWVVCRYFGVSSEVWIDRQVRGFSHLRPSIVCWGAQPSPPCQLHQLPFPALPEERVSRWLRRFQNLPTGNLYGATGREYRALCRLVERTRPAAMLCHFGHMALRLLPVAKRYGIPLVAHFHGLDVSSSLRNKWYRWSLRAALPAFDAIVVVGTHQQRWMLEQGVSQDRVHLIPCGVPTDQFAPDDRPARERAVRFVAVSRLVRWKGLDYTLRAFADVRHADPESTLTIIGDGPDQPALRQLSEELRIAEAVRFTGSIGPQAVRNELQTADVFLQHSLTDASGWTEGFGVSITEAAAMRLPVVVTDCGGIPDQVADGVTGFIVHERDSAAMAERMRRLAAEPVLRQQMGEAGRRRAISEFDTTGQVRKLEQMLIDLIEQRRPD